MGRFNVTWESLAAARVRPRELSGWRRIVGWFDASRAVTASTVIGALLIWYGIAELRLVSDLFVPHPWRVAETAWEILVTGYRGRSLLQHLADSLWRIGVAYVLAAVTATPLGLLSGYVPRVQAAMDWLVEFYRPLPPLSYYVLLVIWLGIDDESKIALLYLAGFAPIYIASLEGVRGVNADRIYVAQCLGATKKQVFFHVILPSCLPDIFTGLRVALGFTYTTLVAAEMVAAVSGVGWMVLDAGKFLRSDVIFVGIFVMGLTGLALDRLVRIVERRVVPWRGKG